MELHNPARNPELHASVRLRAPDGTRWTDPGCAATCERGTLLPPGGRRTVELALTANSPGDRTAQGHVRWTTVGQTVAAQTELRVQFAVRPPPDDTTVELHASDIRVTEGENLTADLSVVNNHPHETMRITMTLKPPDGTSVTATHNAQSCAGECKATYTAPPGEQRTMTIALVANDAGEFIITGRAHWHYGGSHNSRTQTQAVSKYLVLNVDHPPRAREPARNPAPLRAPPKDRRFPGWTYAAVLGGISALCAAAAAGIAWRRRGLPGTNMTSRASGPRVRVLTAVTMTAGVALAVSAVFNQPENTRGADALLLVMPGAALVAASGLAQRFLTPGFALLLSATACLWAMFYIGWSGPAEPSRAAANAALITTLVAAVTAVSYAAQRPNRSTPANIPDNTTTP